MDSAPVLVVLLGAGAALTAWCAVGLTLGRARSWQTMQLRFGRDLTPEVMLSVLNAIAGLRHNRAVALELKADSEGIEHYLSTDRGTLDVLRGIFRATLPSLRLEPVKAPTISSYALGSALWLRGSLGVLRQDDIEAASAGLLAACQPLGKSESLLIRWTLSAGRARPVMREEGGRPRPSDHVRLLRTKNEGAILRARGVVAVAAHPKRARHLLSRVAAVLRARSTAYGHIALLPLPRWLLQPAVALRSVWFGDRYAAAELAGLLGAPVGAPALPGLTLGTSPLRFPSARLPRSGRVVGRATWPGAERPIAQPTIGALSHTLIAGPTGVGKSTLLTNLAVADMTAGRGLVLIDGKGDTAEAALARLPKERAKDIIVLDCAASGPQPGIRLFSDYDHELAADVVLGVLSDLFRDSWGPLSERYLRAGLLAVSHDPKGTLADVPFVYADPAYRRKLIGRVADPLTRATFAAFEQMSPGERAHQLAAPLNKLGALLGRPIVRTVVGQADPKLDFAAVLRERRIVVVSLAPSRVGAPAARLIGALIVYALFRAVQERASLPEARRMPFFVYIDEPRALGDLPMPVDTLLEQARGLGVGVTLAPQSMNQLPKAVREAALTNVATRIVFRSSADDARLLARDLPGVTPEDLSDLAAFEAIARIGLGPGDVAAPVSLKTVPASKALSDPKALRASSAARYGVELAEVDGALNARHAYGSPDSPIGRRRRAS